MSTQFTATVKPSGGDYTSLNAAQVGLANDITAADILVFSISVYSTPTIAAGDTVLGQSSGATGVCVLVNATRTQILIKTIAVASFLSGEIVQKTAVPTTNVTLSNAGDSPIIGIECYSMSDTTAMNIPITYITNSSNYLYIYTPKSERHSGKWNDTKYNLVVDGRAIENYADYLKIDGLQIQGTSSQAILNYSEYIYISNTIIKDCDGIRLTGNGNRIWNNLIYNCDTGIYFSNGVSSYFYNNTIINNVIGFYADSEQDTSNLTKNNLFYNNTTDYFDDTTFDVVFTYTSTNQASGIPAGTGNRYNQAFSFINGSAYDFHLTKNDTGARNYGTDLSADLYLPFTDDIDGQTRPGQAVWDIGADEYFPVISYGYIIG